MSERVVREVVTFATPFFVDGVDREQVAGAYEIETVEEPIHGLSFTAYRTVSTSILLPGPGPHSSQVVPIAAQVVRAARIQSEPTEPDRQAGGP
jgi:hypothetical protein